MYRKYDMETITIRQFADVQKELKKDKEKIYEMLKAEGRYIRICELVKKKIDKSKVTISEFEQIVLELYNAKTNEECEKILTEEAANVYIQDLANLVAIRENLTGYEFYPMYVMDMSTVRYVN